MPGHAPGHPGPPVGPAPELGSPTWILGGPAWLHHSGRLAVAARTAVRLGSPARPGSAAIAADAAAIAADAAGARACAVV